MAWLSFVASLVGSLAWPVAVVTLILLLRHALTQILAAVTRFKWRDFEIEVNRVVAQANAEIAGKPAPGPGQVPAPPGSLTYLQTLAGVSPRAAVLEGWLPPEIAAGRLAEKFGFAKPGVALQMSELIDGLNRKGIITDDEAKALGRLRAIRNRLVHGGEDISSAKPESTRSCCKTSRGAWTPGPRHRREICSPTTRWSRRPRGLLGAAAPRQR